MPARVEATVEVGGDRGELLIERDQLTSHYDCFWHEGHIQRLQHSASASRDEADSWEVGHSRQNIMIVWKIDCPTIRTKPLI